MPGIIYVTSNIGIPDMVKIGRCGMNQLNKRMKNLSGTNVPYAFECNYAFVVEDDLKTEKWLHTIYQDARVNNAREFFKVSPDAVATAIEHLVIQELSVEEDYYSLNELDRFETVKAEKKKLEQDRIDCIIAAANEENHPNAINEVFFGEKCWRSLKISEANRDVLKWFALYKTRPHQEVTHYAKISDIVESPEVPGKFQINFDGDPVALDKAIIHGDSSAPLIQGPRYCNKAQLLASNSLAELFSNDRN